MIIGKEKSNLLHYNPCLDKSRDYTMAMGEENFLEDIMLRCLHRAASHKKHYVNMHTLHT